MAGARDAHAPVTASGTRPTSVPPCGSGPPPPSLGLEARHATTARGRTRGARVRGPSVRARRRPQGRRPHGDETQLPQAVAGRVQEPTAVELQRAEQAATAESTTHTRTHARTHTRARAVRSMAPQDHVSVSGSRAPSSRGPRRLRGASPPPQAGVLRGERRGTGAAAPRALRGARLRSTGFGVYTAEFSRTIRLKVRAPAPALATQT